MSLGLAAGIAHFLGLVGIYGVVSYLVSLRTREIGLRITVGANPSTVRTMILEKGAVLAGFGASAGLVASAGLTRLMGSLLFGVGPQPPSPLLITARTGGMNLRSIPPPLDWVKTMARMSPPS